VKKKPANARTLLIPLGISFLFSALYLLPFFIRMEGGLYDIYLGLKPAVKENSSITLLDVDDEAIDKVGSWPWPRGLLADGLLLLKDFGAAYAVFDIEYLNRSPPGIDTWYLEKGLVNDFEAGFSEISSGFMQLVDSMAAGRLKAREALGYAKQINEYILETKNGLLKRAKSVAVDNDSYLGRAMKLYGSTFTTLNIQEVEITTNDPEARALALSGYAYPKMVERGHLPNEAKDFLVPIRPVVSGSKGAGFTNIHIDPDGKRRRLKLFVKSGDKWYPQLVMAPVLDRLGSPEVEISRKRIVLKNADFPGGIRKTVTIPLDETGNMILNWPKKTFEESYSHVSFYKLIDLARLEAELPVLVGDLARSQIWGIGAADPAIAERLGMASFMCAALSGQATDLVNARRAVVETGSEDAFSSYAEGKRVFLDKVSAFLEGDAQTTAAAAVGLLNASNTDVEVLASTRQEMDSLNALFQQLRDKFAFIREYRQRLSDMLGGKICIIGWTATSTTDFGVNPFQGKYPNVGTHATVANTILNRAFLDIAPRWISVLMAIVLSVGLVLVARGLPPLWQTVVGAGAVFGLLGGILALFIATGIFVGPLGPGLSLSVSFVAYSLGEFFTNEREKNFLRKAFSTYLSGEVIEEILEDPGKLALGGDRRELTAMFTDVRGFSTISEQLDPESLVRLLNLYLSAMSDTILNERGTIDKYEGDAIISFFGAPVALPAHANAACRSAILMKRAETELNRRLALEQLSPGPLLTRIGINSGDMVVGNMGTERKMDYTIMGNAVNLAARLEGVNKRYGSWILASGETIAAAGDEFLSRRMDRVRVVGINQPVQLYELIDFKSEADPRQGDFLAGFQAALDIFLLKDWPRAKAAFEDLARLDLNDGPTQYYVQRSKEFLKNPPLEGWDGVFSLTEK